MMTGERLPVNKKHGLKKFGEVGSLVIDEDLRYWVKRVRK